MTTADTLVRMIEVDYDPFAAPQVVRSFPTTDAQREIWLAAELGSEASLAYNESISLQMKGRLDVGTLQAALQALADRHEALRATFDADGASMVIASQINLTAKLIDLSGMVPGDREESLARLRAEAVETPFDLLNGPLIRAVLVRTAADTNELILTAHHIVCDGWSFGIISRDLMTLYRQLAAGKSAVKLPPADSFGDYSLSAHEPEHVRTSDEDEQYWVRVFDRGQPVLDLPTDAPRAAQRAFASRRIDYALPQHLVEKARQLGAKQGVSLFATLFGLFAALLERLGGDGEVVVGVPAAGQSTRGLNALVGHCVNVLPVRVTTDRQASVASLLKHAGSCVLDAYDHQSCTFGRLLTKLNVPREANRLPLVSVLFNIDAAIPSDALSLEGLTVSLRSNPRAFENFELFVNASQTDQGILLETQYHSELFEAETVQRWLALYACALERAAADPLRPVAEVFSATDDDIERLQKFNQSSQPYAQGDRIESLISRQAALTPDATAVVSGNERLTYRELEERSDAVAQALIGRGIGSGQLAGMACSRNIHLLPAMLGILKSGAAYVPLDPSLPEERLTYMCSDAEIRCVVADRSAPPSFSGIVEPVFVDDLAAASETIPQVVDPMGAAYVIYTSGSTGKPKGVVVPHRAVVNFLNSMAREPGLSALDRLVAVTTTSFDIAVLELFLPLTAGAQVIIADRDTVLDGGSLRNLIEKHDATVVQATPAGWRLLVDAGWTGGPGFKALVGGEALPDDLASELVKRAGSVWNMYGPTETTVWSTCWELTSDRKGIRIGRPIANTEVWILDESLKPCPIGVPGEIFIGGDGVTTGYWRRPELTAERFVMFEGRRIYRTGDRGRWRNDGTLEHLGRLDFQVKVRGYRIELGEIESNLIQLGDIDRAVVLAREDEPGDVRLVAYVVSGSPIEPKTVRSSLRKRLPDYMIPGHIMQLPAIPLLPNGKVDRKSLPKPPSNKVVSVHSSAGPATDLEARVLHDFESVLKLSGIGLDDDFFALGGHSLLAAELAHRLAKVAGRRVPLRAVFDAPTARKMSVALSGTADAQPTATVRSIPVQPDQSTAPLTTMQQGIYLAETMYPGRVTNNAPSAHRLRGPFNAGAFRRALEVMMARQPILRTSMFKGPAGTVQRVQNVTDFPLIEEDLSTLPEGMREKELMARMQTVVDRPIDIHEFPLFRAVLYKLKPEEHVFLFMPHHIIWDGWSFDILYDELDRNYPDALAGSANAEPLSISYVDFAHWHHHWLQGAEYKAQLAYWKTQLERSAQMRPLPTDRLRKRTNDSDTGTEWIMIDKPAADAVHDLAGKIGATANLIVMAIHALQLSEAANGPAVALGMTMRGRTDAALEPVMGLFVNVVPVLIGIDPAISLREHVHNVRNVLIEAIANQEVPFEHLSADPAFQAYQSRAGAFQSMYSFQDARARRNAWGPLQHSRVSVMQKDSPADFGLWLIEVPEGMQGAISYRTALWDQSTAQLFKERFLGLIERAVANPEATLGELLSSPGEDRAGMAAWLRSRDPNVAPSDTPRAAGPHAIPAASNVKLERKLAQIWADLLGLDAADIHAEDNFFDIGGNSLLVMRAVEQSRQQLGLVVEPHRYVYETVRLLSVPATADPEPGASSEPEQAMRTPRVAGVLGKG